MKQFTTIFDQHLRTTVPFVIAHLEIFHCTHHPIIPVSHLYLQGGGKHPPPQCYTESKKPQCMIEIWRAGVVTPPPLQATFAFTHPYFKTFLERFLNDLPPHHPTSSIFHCYPSPSTIPAP